MVNYLSTFHCKVLETRLYTFENRFVMVKFHTDYPLNWCKFAPNKSALIHKIYVVKLIILALFSLKIILGKYYTYYVLKALPPVYMKYTARDESRVVNIA